MTSEKKGPLVAIVWLAASVTTQGREGQEHLAEMQAEGTETRDLLLQERPRPEPPLLSH